MRASRSESAHDGDTGDARVTAGSDDPDSDFASVGDQYLLHASQSRVISLAGRDMVTYCTAGGGEVTLPGPWGPDWSDVVEFETHLG